MAPVETSVEAPSKQQLLKATGMAVLVAVVIFFTVVLPAEYGRDPLHTGSALGLMNLSKPAATASNVTGRRDGGGSGGSAGRSGRGSGHQGDVCGATRAATKPTRGS